MKNIKVLILAAAAFATTQSMAQTSTKGSVGRTINKIGNKSAQIAVKGASGVADKKYDRKVGPSGQTIYINKNSSYYWVNARGKKIYISKSKLIDKPRR